MQDIRIKTAELYARYADILYRTAYAKLLSAHDAEDAVSETFAKYLGKTPEFRDSSHERAWFLRVCINTCTDIMRRRSVRSYTPLDELAEALLSSRRPDKNAARDELLKTVACKAAIKAGRSSEPEELLRLAEAVCSGEVRYCPHGRPVVWTLTRRDLDKQFRRIL